MRRGLSPAFAKVPAGSFTGVQNALPGLHLKKAERGVSALRGIGVSGMIGGLERPLQTTRARGRVAGGVDEGTEPP